MNPCTCTYGSSPPLLHWQLPELAAPVTWLLSSVYLEQLSSFWILLECLTTVSIIKQYAHVIKKSLINYMYLIVDSSLNYETTLIIFVKHVPSPRYILHWNWCRKIFGDSVTVIMIHSSCWHPILILSYSSYSWG